MVDDADERDSEEALIAGAKVGAMEDGNMDMGEADEENSSELEMGTNSREGEGPTPCSAAPLARLEGPSTG